METPIAKLITVSSCDPACAPMSLRVSRYTKDFNSSSVSWLFIFRSSAQGMRQGVDHLDFGFPRRLPSVDYTSRLLLADIEIRVSVICQPAACRSSVVIDFRHDVAPVVVG